jgi:CRISPR-associated endonuclease Csn1
MKSNLPISPLTLALDVGHSSIGWSLLTNLGTRETPKPSVHAAGVVTFPADDCLAKKRRTYRRQRRHVRSISQRIRRTADLLIHLGALKAGEVSQKHRQGGGHPAPWLLAARVLASGGSKEHLLSWSQLWDVLRWYAHNRGYDGNKRWSRTDDEDEEDVEKVTNALEMMTSLACKTMAETMTRFMFKPFGEQDILQMDPAKLPPFNLEKSANLCRFKGKNVAFRRETVEVEVARILRAHLGHLPALDEKLIESLLHDSRAVPCPAIKLPKRYQGGLLFGQLVPRFDNRILTKCPFTHQTVPTRHSFEFLRYRWAMQIANILVGVAGDKGLHPLRKEERAALHEKMLQRGYLTPGELKTFVKEITGSQWTNLEAMLLQETAKEGLELYPVAKGRDAFRGVWAHLSPKHRQRFANQLMRGKELTPEVIATWLREYGEAATADKMLENLVVNKKGKTDPEKSAALRGEVIAFRKLSGRAPYSSARLLQAEKEVLEGYDPRKECKGSNPKSGEVKPEDGCLFRSQRILDEALKRPLDEQTNNHLIRQRLHILEKLIRNIQGNPSLTNGQKIENAVIEVNRDLQAMSGMTAKEMASDMGLRLSAFKSAVAYLEEAYEGKNILITPSLIRKARVAMDTNWTCPYTGRKFDAISLAKSKEWDKDHIIPYSLRPSNSLESLVITTATINREKKNRTGLQFVEEMNLPENEKLKREFGVCTVREYREFVESLDVRRGHDDDRKRKRRRQGLMLLGKWEEKAEGFLPKDLTVTSQIVRLGQQSVQRALPHLEPHQVTAMPGSVTAVLRNGWKLLGLLARANPNVLEAETGEMKIKTEIRDITHLHHALDACTIGLAEMYFPRNGGLWTLITKRNPSPLEKQQMEALGIFKPDSEGRLQLARDPGEAVKEQIAACLMEKRVVQHVPKDMSGMKVEENTRRVVAIHEGRAKLRQRVRDPKTGKISQKETEEPLIKLVGLRDGKLKQQQGVRVITDNFGVAVLNALPEGTPDAERFQIIPWHRVWHRLGELKKLNRGQKPLILRAGQVIQVAEGNFQGTWMLHSVKNNATGMAVDMGWPDVVTLRNKTEGHKINVRLASLLKGGLMVREAGLAGS